MLFLFRKPSPRVKSENAQCLLFGTPKHQLSLVAWRYSDLIGNMLQHSQV
jgi:hypothetical protein